MIIVKFGGSVITDKKQKVKTLRRDVLRRLARELASAQDDTILVHGAGSYGHPEAKKYNLKEGYKGDSQLPGLAKVQRDVRELNMEVMNALLDAELAPVQVAPGSMISFNNRKLASMDLDIYDNYLKLGATPVSFGDVVRDRKQGFAICSGDLIMLELAKHFKPSLAVFVADVDGLYDANPTIDKNAKLIPVVTKDTIKMVRNVEMDCDDVTGSMIGKVLIAIEMARSGVETMIINGTVEGRLRRALADATDVIGTRVPAQRK